MFIRLFMRCVAALLLTLGTRGWTDDEKTLQRDAPLRTLRTVPSRILQLDEKRANVLHEETPRESLLRLDAQPGQAAVRERADGLTSSGPTPGNLVRLKESAPWHMRSRQDGSPLSGANDPDATLALKLAMDMSRPHSHAPDERPLWRMLASGRYEALLERLERLRKAFPAWRPPARLAGLAREGWLRLRIEQARQTADHEAMIQLARSHPEAFDCSRIVAAWSLAEAQAALGRHREVDDTVRLLLACPDEADRLATLYKSREWLAEGWEQFIAIEERMARSPEGEERFSRLRYDYRMAQLLAAVESGSDETALRLLSPLTPEIERRKDAGAALLAGWIRYRAGQPGAAAAFASALQWDAGRHEARRGLALIALQEKRHEEALHHAEAMPEDVEGRSLLLRDVRLAQAQAAHDAGRYHEAVRYLDAAAANAALPRHAQLLDAWSRLQAGDAVEAALGFARLYGEEADMESAQGALLALPRSGREDELRQLARSGPLAGLLARRDASLAFDGKRFLAAASLDAQSYAGLGSVASPRAAMIAAARSKSGSAGMSRLDLAWQPAAEAVVSVGTAGELRLRLDRVLLDSGVLPANMPIGSFPAGGGGHAGGGYAYSPAARMRGWQPHLSWRDEREHVWEAELGTTPIGGEAGLGVTGRVAFRHKEGKWQMAAYREPVRESMLSYVGMRDPYQGGVWGRVLRTGARGGGKLPLGERWALSGQITAEHLGGEQVAGNRKIGAEAGISWSMNPGGMDFAVLGISATVERYAHNLSRFTLGHGGYFSPQRYWRLGPSLDFMTEENRGFLIQGRISAGRTGKHESTAPYFPLAPDGRMYAASSGTGMAYDVELNAVWRLNRYVQVGASLTQRSSPQYRDHAALGFVRIQFEPGKAVLSSDLPAASGKELF